MTQPTLGALMLVFCSAGFVHAQPAGQVQRNHAFDVAFREDLFKQDGNGNGETEAPEHIRDNGMLVEEAFNQEPGDVQHIFNWINLWDRAAQTRTRDFLFTYTMELPLGSQKHQFSFTVPFLTLYEKPAQAPAAQSGDIGDIFLNYRYQLLADDDFLWCAPRFTVILPTGDERFGTGTGQLGYQFNLPVSRYGEKWDFHVNLGATYVPGVSALLDTGLFSPRRDLGVYNLGASAFLKPSSRFHLMLEALALWIDGIDDLGFREQQTQLFLNPGFRFAICQLDQVEWVVGLGVPIGLTPDTPDIGIFGYMSVEHDFRKKHRNGE